MTTPRDYIARLILDNASFMSNLTSSTKAVTDMSAGLDKAKPAVAGLEAAQKSAATSTKALDTAHVAAAASATKVASSAKAAGDATATAGNESLAAAGKIKQLDVSMKGAHESGGLLHGTLGKIASIAGGITLGGGLLALPGMLHSAIDAAVEDEAATVRVSQVIQNLGGDIEANTAKVNSAISAGQKLAFSDDEVRDSFAKLATATGSADEALSRQKLAMDVARGAHIPLLQASTLLGKVTDENVNVFKRMGITMEKGATEAEVMATLQGKFSGQANAYANSTAGQFARAKLALSESAESIGYLVLPAVTKLAGAFASGVTHIQAFVGTLADSAPYKAFTGYISDSLGKVGAWVAPAKEAIAGFLQLFKNPLDEQAWMDGFHRLRLALSSVFGEEMGGRIASFVGDIAGTLQDMASKFDGIGERVKNWGIGLMNTLRPLGQGLFKGLMDGLQAVEPRLDRLADVLSNKIIPRFIIFTAVIGQALTPIVYEAVKLAIEGLVTAILLLAEGLAFVLDKAILFFQFLNEHKTTATILKDILKALAVVFGSLYIAEQVATKINLMVTSMKAAKTAAEGLFEKINPLTGETRKLGDSLGGIKDKAITFVMDGLEAAKQHAEDLLTALGKLKDKGINFTAMGLEQAKKHADELQTLLTNIKDKVLNFSAQGLEEADKALNGFSNKLGALAAERAVKVKLDFDESAMSKDAEKAGTKGASAFSTGFASGIGGLIAGLVGPKLLTELGKIILPSIGFRALARPIITGIGEGIATIGAVTLGALLLAAVLTAGAVLLHVKFPGTESAINEWLDTYITKPFTNFFQHTLPNFLKTPVSGEDIGFLIGSIFGGAAGIIETSGALIIKAVQKVYDFLKTPIDTSAVEAGLSRLMGFLTTPIDTSVVEAGLSRLMGFLTTPIDTSVVTEPIGRFYDFLKTPIDLSGVTGPLETFFNFLKTPIDLSSVQSALSTFYDFLQTPISVDDVKAAISSFYAFLQTSVDLSGVQDALQGFYDFLQTPIDTSGFEASIGTIVSKSHELAGLGLDSVTSALGDLFDLLAKPIDTSGITDGLGNLYDLLKKPIDTSAITDALGTLYEFLKKPIPIPEGIQSFVSDFFEPITRGFGTQLEGIRTLVREKLKFDSSFIGDHLSEGFATIRHNVETAFEGIRSFGSTALAQLQSFGSTALGGLGTAFDGAKTAGQRVLDVISGIRNGLASAFSLRISWPEPPGWLDKLIPHSPPPLAQGFAMVGDAADIAMPKIGAFFGAFPSGGDSVSIGTDFLATRMPAGITAVGDAAESTTPALESVSIGLDGLASHAPPVTEALTANADAYHYWANAISDTNKNDNLKKLNEDLRLWTAHLIDLKQQLGNVAPFSAQAAAIQANIQIHTAQIAKIKDLITIETDERKSIADSITALDGFNDAMWTTQLTVEATARLGAGGAGIFQTLLMGGNDAKTGQQLATQLTKLLDDAKKAGVQGLAEMGPALQAALRTALAHLDDPTMIQPFLNLLADLNTRTKQLTALTATTFTEGLSRIAHNQALVADFGTQGAALFTAFDDAARTGGEMSLQTVLTGSQAILDSLKNIPATISGPLRDEYIAAMQAFLTDPTVDARGRLEADVRAINDVVNLIPANFDKLPEFVRGAIGGMVMQVESGALSLTSAVERQKAIIGDLPKSFKGWPSAATEAWNAVAGAIASGIMPIGASIDDLNGILKSFPANLAEMGPQVASAMQVIVQSVLSGVVSMEEGMDRLNKVIKAGSSFASAQASAASSAGRAASSGGGASSTSSQPAGPGAYPESSISSTVDGITHMMITNFKGLLGLERHTETGAGGNLINSGFANSDPGAISVLNAGGAGVDANLRSIAMLPQANQQAWISSINAQILQTYAQRTDPRLNGGYGAVPVEYRGATGFDSPRSVLGYPYRDPVDEQGNPTTLLDQIMRRQQASMDSERDAGRSNPYALPVPNGATSGAQLGTDIAAALGPVLGPIFARLDTTLGAVATNTSIIAGTNTSGLPATVTGAAGLISSRASLPVAMSSTEVATFANGARDVQQGGGQIAGAGATLDNFGNVIPAVFQGNQDAFHTYIDLFGAGATDFSDVVNTVPMAITGAGDVVEGIITNAGNITIDGINTSTANLTTATANFQTQVNTGGGAAQSQVDAAQTQLQAAQSQITAAQSQIAAIQGLPSLSPADIATTTVSAAAATVDAASALAASAAALSAAAASLRSSTPAAAFGMVALANGGGMLPGGAQLVNGPTHALIGEDGPEVVLPLTKAYAFWDLVDHMMAQGFLPEKPAGLKDRPGMANGGAAMPASPYFIRAGAGSGRGRGDTTINVHTTVGGDGNPDATERAVDRSLYKAKLKDAVAAAQGVW